MKGNPWPGSLQWGWIIPTAWLYSLWNLLTWLLLIFLLLLPGRHPAAADSGRPQGSLWLLWTLQPWLWNPQPPRHPPGSGTWGRGQYLGWILGGELRRGGVVVQREWEEGRRREEEGRDGCSEGKERKGSREEELTWATEWDEDDNRNLERQHLVDVVNVTKQQIKSGNKTNCLDWYKWSGSKLKTGWRKVRKQCYFSYCAFFFSFFLLSIFQEVKRSLSLDMFVGAVFVWTACYVR